MDIKTAAMQANLRLINSSLYHLQQEIRTLPSLPADRMPTPAEFEQLDRALNSIVASALATHKRMEDVQWGRK